MKNPTTIFQIKLPNALITGIQNCLKEILFENSYSDKAVNNMLKSHPSWGSRDRKITTRIIYTLTRNYILYSYISEQIWDEEFEDTKENKIHLLIFLTMLMDENFSSKVECSEELESQIKSLTDIPKNIQHSIQSWMYDEIVKDWGEEASVIIESLDQPAPVYIRYNSLKTTAQKLNSELERLKIDFEYDAQVGGAIRINNNNQLRQSQAFKEGLFEFQDIGSQYIIKQAGIHPEQVVVDFCAGKGGKTLQICSLMKNEGRLIASDIDISRLTHLEKRAKKAGVKNLEIISNESIIKNKNLMADVVFIDAPCSGIGTIRRQPDLKFRFQQSQLPTILETQQEILSQSASLVRAKGRIVYATCSILKSENSEQIEKFLASHPSFQLKQEEYIFPFQLDGDGFYVAVLEKA
ncbi:MAG TPA: RsmB/NOP family class I SAM-dependent RNA methyltransferase [Chitinophagales bacterium]|nr:RsmB/NOP family class I SAM-dependent RNA methyltransferase [Chitinophagales bacterium]